MLIKDKSEMNIVYSINNYNYINIFGSQFVKNNKSICKMIIDNNEYEITEQYNVNNYNNNKLQIKLKGINNVTNMSHMFYECQSLLSLPDISKWNINNAVNIHCMFKGCKSLLSLPDISKWNTNNVINMNSMFDGCKSLSSVFDFGKIYKTKSLSDFPKNSKIFIKTITGKTIFIYYLYDDTIQNIKNKIKIKEGIPSELQLLFLNKKELEDNRTLKYYNIPNKSILHLVLKKK